MSDDSHDSGESRKPITQTMRIRPPTGEVSTATATQTMRVRGPTTAELSSTVLSRYRIQGREGERAVVAEDVRSVLLWIRPGLSVTEEGRRDFPKQVIFLDGAFHGPPFLDNERRQ